MWELFIQKLRTMRNDGENGYGGMTMGGETGSAPDDALLIEEVIDDFDAIAHLDLCLF